MAGHTASVYMEQGANLSCLYGANGVASFFIFCKESSNSVCFHYIATTADWYQSCIGFSAGTVGDTDT